jgi:hypothetical protein
MRGPIVFLLASAGGAILGVSLVVSANTGDLLKGSIVAAIGGLVVVAAARIGRSADR